MALFAKAALSRQITYLLIALSLGHLTFIRRWYDLENLRLRSLDYFRGGPSPAGDVLFEATLISSLIAAALFRLAWLCVERNPRWRVAGECIFPLALAFPLESIRQYWTAQAHGVDWVISGVLILMELVLVAASAFRLRGSPHLVRSSRAFALAAVLLVGAMVFDLGMAGTSAEAAESFSPRKPLARLPARAAEPRFLWILFDELDQRLVFEARPAGVEMPELDRLRSESAVANRVTQAGTDTIQSVPSLFTGKEVREVQPIGAATLLVTASQSQQALPWNQQPSVFQKAREKGFNTELAGWYHPYCRVLGDQLVRCTALSTERTPSLQLQTLAARVGLWNTVGTLWRLQIHSLSNVFRGIPYSGWLVEQDRLVQHQQQQQYFQIRDALYRAAADQDLGLGFFHVPAPHLFPLYDPQAKSFQLRDGLDYIDNLALVDRTVGELRRTLEQSGMWDRTTLLITADHALRPTLWRNSLGWSPRMDEATASGADNRVPFILKVAGDHTPAVLDEPVSARVSADLAMAILCGEVGTNAEAVAWLRTRVK